MREFENWWPEIDRQFQNMHQAITSVAKLNHKLSLFMDDINQ